MGDFDFDYWKDLAERDPAAFFQARDAALQHCIACHHGQAHALAAFQTRIDATRVLAGSPMQASRALFELMEDQLRLLGAKLVELRLETESLRGTLARETTV